MPSYAVRFSLDHQPLPLCRRQPLLLPLLAASG
jgi:hypothetical protein